MATAMKINKTQYLAKCKEALAKYDAPEAEYQKAKAEYDKQLESWAKSIIAKKQIVHNGEASYRSEFRPSQDAPRPPQQPHREEFYRKAGLERSYFNSYNQHEANIKKLREVITLLEMTDGETVGVSVANKVSELL